MRRCAAVVVTVMMVAGCGGDAPVAPVQPAVSRIVIDKDTVHTLPGTTAQLTATVVGENGAVISGSGLRWVSRNPEVARVSSSGLVEGLSPGRAVIEARVGSVVDTALARVNLSGKYTAVAADGKTLPAKVKQGFACTHFGAPHTADLDVRAARVTFTATQYLLEIDKRSICGPIGSDGVSQEIGFYEIADGRVYGVSPRTGTRTDTFQDATISGNTLAFTHRIFASGSYHPVRFVARQ